MLAWIGVRVFALLFLSVPSRSIWWKFGGNLPDEPQITTQEAYHNVIVARIHTDQKDPVTLAVISTMYGSAAGNFLQKL